MADAKRCINILAVDGGGIRGIIPATILAEIERKIGLHIHEAFDLIAGTSTGGIVAVAIGAEANNGNPYAPEDLVVSTFRTAPTSSTRRFSRRGKLDSAQVLFRNLSSESPKILWRDGLEISGGSTSDRQLRCRKPDSVLLQERAHS